MAHLDYEHQASWRSYQPHLPPRLRLCPGELPREERWQWQGIAVHVDRYEQPDAPVTVIGLHGGGGYGRLLAPIGLLARRLGYEAVLPDLPGYGLTRVPRQRFTYPMWVACARDLAVAERERADRPVMALGASMGGMLAWHAATAGAPLAGIVATTLIDPRDPEVLASLGRSRWAGRLGARLLRAAPPLSDPLPVPMAAAANMNAIANDPAVARLARNDKLGGGKRVPARFLRTWIDYTPAIEPEASRVPVLLAHPAADRWTPTELSERFLLRLAGPTQLVTLDRCGHFPLEEPGLTQLEAAFADFATKIGNARPSGRTV
ncbi:MAG: alpha/beta fold hydrolase [Solirubrobacteraceae bacterium]